MASKGRGREEFRGDGRRHAGTVNCVRRGVSVRTRKLTVGLGGLAGVIAVVLAMVLATDSGAKRTSLPTSASFTASDFQWDAAGGGHTVTIAQGGTVDFGYPVGSSDHNADFGSGAAPTSCSQNAGASSGTVPPLPHNPTPAGWSGDCTFNTLGRYTFHCDLHPFMTGTVVVEGDGSIGSPAVSLTSSAAGARAVTYTLTFTATDAIPASTGTITVQAPAGTVFSAIAAHLFDLTTAQDLGSTHPAAVSGGGADASWTLGPTGVPAGHQVRLTIPGVTNPGPATTNRLSVSTLADATPVTTPDYTTTPARPVSALTASLSDAKARASGVTYKVTMRLSATGGLEGRRGTVTLVAPAGTVIPPRAVDLFDVTTAKDLGRTATPARFRSDATATWRVGRAVPAGHKIRLTISGVKNPVAGTYRLGASTSSDTVMAKSKAYVIRR
jgi:plastocyanin